MLTELMGETDAFPYYPDLDHARKGRQNTKKLFTCIILFLIDCIILVVSLKQLRKNYKDIF
jgi:hypothetical protein